MVVDEDGFALFAALGSWRWSIVLTSRSVKTLGEFVVAYLRIFLSRGYANGTFKADDGGLCRRRRLLHLAGLSSRHPFGGQLSGWDGDGCGRWLLGLE